MARGAVRAPYTASSAKPFVNKRSKAAKSRATDGELPKPKPQARSTATQHLEPDDAYTYLPSLPKRHRTSAVQLSLTKDEAAAAAGPSRRRQPGGDSEDDEEDMEERIRKVAMQIAEEGPGLVESDESDVDSDLAWEEGGSDEERWGDVFRDLNKGKGKKVKGKAKEVVKKPAKPLTVNLDESEDEESASQGVKSSKATLAVSSDDDAEDSDGDEEEDEEDPDDGEDEEMDEFDGEEFKGFGSGDEESDDEDGEEEDLRAFKPNKLAMAVKDAEDDSEEEEDEEDEEEDEEAESDPDLPSDVSDDEADPTSLDALDAFVDKLAAEDAKKRKVAFEDETPDEGKKRRVLPVVSGPAVGDGEQTLRSDGKLDISTLLASHPSLASARALLPAKSRPDSTYKSVLKSGVLSAPLPTIVQERLDREAAYEKTKEEGAKWSGVMKRVKEAEHLSFPLQQPGGVERGGTKSGGEMISTFKPQNEMESAVQRLLDSANLTEKGMTELEDQQLQGQDLTVEEIAARRAELRRQRELLFRAENRAKRVAKIKSKTFRKLARKRAEKEGLSVEDMERLEPGTMEREREKLERERAKERATQRHGARNKFGAEAMKGDFGNDDRRKAREEMLDLKERLTRRIAGRTSDDEEDDDDEDEDEEDEEEGGEEGIKIKAFDQFAQLDKAQPEETGGKGLMGMKFMQKAREREMARVREAEEEAKRDIMLFGQEGQEDEEGDEEETNMLKMGEGRMVFSGPAPTKDSNVPTPTPTVEPPQSSSAGLKRSALTASGTRSSSPESNPWLNSASTSAGPSRKRNTLAINTSADKATQSLKKAKKRNTDQAELAEDERVDIVLDNPPALPSSSRANGKKRTAAGEGEDEDVENDLMPSRPAMFKQRDLVAEAFAGDDVVADFAKDKARQIEMDAPKVEDTSLAGWGSWGGKGLKKRKPNPKFLLKTSGIEPTQRKDFGQSNVILTERSDRKAKKFLPKDLPYPYTSVAQYQASLAQPVGGEWNSRTAVQRETLPRVIKKPGAIIEPVRRLF